MRLNTPDGEIRPTDYDLSKALALEPCPVYETPEAAPASPPGGAADPASESPSTAGCATCGVKGFPHYDRLPTGTWVCAPCHDALGSGSCSPVPTPEQRVSPAPGETPAARVHGCAGGLCAHGEVCQYHAAFPAPPATPPGTGAPYVDPDPTRPLTREAKARAAPPPVTEPIWTTTACPHCGGEVDGIRVLTEAELGRAAPPPGETDRDAEFYCGCEHHRPGADARALWDEDGCCQVCGVDVDPWTIRALHAERDRDEARAAPAPGGADLGAMLDALVAAVADLTAADEDAEEDAARERMKAARQRVVSAWEAMRAEVERLKAQAERDNATVRRLNAQRNALQTEAADNMARADAAERALSEARAERDDHLRAEASAWQQREEIAAELAEARSALSRARGALAGCVAYLWPAPDEGHTGFVDRLGMEFYRETGVWPPFKSEPMEIARPDVDREAASKQWRSWLEAKRDFAAAEAARALAQETPAGSKEGA